MPTTKKPKSKSKRDRRSEKALLEKIHLHAAGIDIGARQHFVAVPAERDPKPVRSFGTFTSDLHRLADWLRECGIETVAMESTGVYWIPVFQILEARGLEVLLVNARHVKNLPGRKTDVVDCQWLQQLHTLGLLRGSFRPADAICVLRSYLRYRDSLVRDAHTQIHRMQKALQQMNVQLHHVLSDITGATGMAILRAIVAGERDPVKLAALKHTRVQSSTETIAKALEGDYRPEHLFALKTALELYDFYQLKLMECDQEVSQQLEKFESKTALEKPVPEHPETEAKPRRRSAASLAAQKLCDRLHEMSGVDLTKVPGFGVLAAQNLMAEIGLQMDRWRTDKHFTSWLGVCPPTRISGGKALPSKPRKSPNRAANILRLAAQSAMQSNTAIGAYIRRLKSKLGAPTAINAGAHKLARLIYRMLKFGQEYQELGADHYDRRHRDRVLRNLERRAADFGFSLTPAMNDVVS
jgi:transposase